MQHTASHISSMRERFAAPTGPTPAAIHARREAIFAMPTRHQADLRRKLLAMAHTEARLLPADTDIQALLATPIKARCLCDPAVIRSMMRMRDEGLTLRPAALLPLDEFYVPYHNGKLDFSKLQDLVEKMLASGTYYDSDTPQVAALNLLLESGVFNGCTTHNGMAFPLALHLQAGINRLATCYRNDFPALLNHMPRAVLTLPDHNGATPLSIAIEQRNSELVTALLRRGVEASLNAPDAEGATPLLRAVRTGQCGIARALLIMGAEPSLSHPDRNGITPLHAAVSNGMEDIVRVLLPYVSNDVLNCPNPCTGATPLLLAARKKHSLIVSELLSNGASVSVDVADSHGETPLQAAGECVEIVMLLLAHGAALASLHAATAPTFPCAQAA
jgi:hypothetical protein